MQIDSPHLAARRASMKAIITGKRKPQGKVILEYILMMTIKP
jgi:hypothetical protein